MTGDAELTGTKDPVWRRPWYLDTSLLYDFIDRNVRRAHSEAVPHDGATILRIKGNKSGTWVPAIQRPSGTRVQYELNRTFNRLRLIHFCHETEFYYSQLTKAEVFRRLRRGHGEQDSESIVDWWNSMSWLLISYREAPLTFPRPEDIADLALQFPIAKNIQDYLHLAVAKANGLEFVTSDGLNGQIEALRRDYYENIHYWDDLQGQVPLDCIEASEDEVAVDMPSD